jgi:SAM-dependent methyltransferase
MHFIRRAACISAAALLATSFAYTPAFAADKGAETKPGEFQPQVGQEGKDVIWVPTPQSLVDRMLDMAKLTPKDIHYDLGSGDGRTVITAAKRGTQSYGVEYNPDMVALSQRAAAKEGVSGKATFIQGDIFQTDFSKATVLTLYLLPSLNLKLRPTILNMRPGTRVVSHAFTMDDWEADQVDSSEGRTAYMWIVPAKVAGTWKIDITGGTRSYEATFTQQYQKIGGSARAGEKLATFSNGKLRGETITFTVDDGGKREFTGRVTGDHMEGTAKGTGGDVKWTATRVAAK